MYCSYGTGTGTGTASTGYPASTSAWNSAWLIGLEFAGGIPSGFEATFDLGDGLRPVLCETNMLD